MSIVNKFDWQTSVVSVAGAIFVGFMCFAVGVKLSLTAQVSVHCTESKHIAHQLNIIICLSIIQSCDAHKYWH